LTFNIVVNAFRDCYLYALVYLAGKDRRFCPVFFLTGVSRKLIFGVISLITFSILIFSPSIIYGQHKILTNMELIEKVSDEAIQELLSNIDVPMQDGLILIDKIKGVGAIDFIFDNTLLKQMKSRGWRITVADEKNKGSEAKYRFSYRIIKLSFDYPRISRKYWLGAKMVERDAKILVFAKVEDVATGDIRWVGESEKNYSDEISYSILDRVEDKEYEFTMPDRKELKWGKIAEPVVVTGIVAGLIYLFFSNQSNE